MAIHSSRKVSSKSAWNATRERGNLGLQSALCTLTLHVELLASAGIFYGWNICVCAFAHECRVMGRSLYETDTATPKKVAALSAVRPNHTLAVTRMAHTAKIDVCGILIIQILMLHITWGHDTFIMLLSCFAMPSGRQYHIQKTVEL